MAIENESPKGVLKFLDEIIRFRKEHSITDIIKGVFWFICLVMLGWFMIAPGHFFEAYDKYREETHMVLMQRRQNNTPQVQAKCDALRYTLNADRVLAFELHNNTNNLAGLPFFFASSSCESLADNIAPVAQQYSEMRLSLYPFATTLFKNEYWIGEVENMKEIDKSLYYRMMSDNIKYAGFIVIEGRDGAEGIIVVNYSRTEGIPDEDTIHRELHKASGSIAGLLTTHDSNSHKKK